MVNTENRDIGRVAADIKRRLLSVDVPKGMNVELRGEYARMKESYTSLGGGLVLASILVFLLMVHMLGGIRLLVIENMDWHDGQKRIATIVAGLSAVITLIFLARLF